MQFGPIQNIIWLLVFAGGWSIGIPERVTSAITGANNGSVESLIFSLAIVNAVGLLKLGRF